MEKSETPTEDTPAIPEVPVLDTVEIVPSDSSQKNETTH